MIVLPVNLAANLFSSKHVAFDATLGRNVRGEATVVQSADRDIFGAIQPPSDKTVALLPAGAVADGVLIMHTASVINLATPRNGAVDTLQTYVRHEGEVWKVWALQGWTPHVAGGVKRYYLTKYLDPNGLIT